MPSEAVPNTVLANYREIWSHLRAQPSAEDIAIYTRDDLWRSLFQRFFQDNNFGNEPYFNAFLREYKKYVNALEVAYLSAVTAGHDKASDEEVAYDHRTMPGVNQELEDVDARLIEIYTVNSSDCSRASDYGLYLTELQEINPVESVASRSRSFSYLPEESLLGDDIENGAQDWIFSINPRVFFGFTAVLGAAAVAVAFWALNAMTLGTAGLITAGIGASFFFTGAIGSGVTACGNHHREELNVSFGS